MSTVSVWNYHASAEQQDNYLSILDNTGFSVKSCPIISRSEDETKYQFRPKFVVSYGSEKYLQINSMEHIDDLWQLLGFGKNTWVFHDLFRSLGAKCEIVDTFLNNLDRGLDRSELDVYSIKASKPKDMRLWFSRWDRLPKKPKNADDGFFLISNVEKSGIQFDIFALQIAKLETAIWTIVIRPQEIGVDLQKVRAVFDWLTKVDTDSKQSAQHNIVVSKGNTRIE